MISPAHSQKALEFIISRIVSEGAREGTPLTEIEEKMLYFSETAWTLPDMAAINAQFDSEYDQTAYEDKISTLIRNYSNRIRNEEPSEAARWSCALQNLKGEDRYLLVLTGLADGSLTPTTHSRNLRFLKLLLVGVGLGLIAMAILGVILYFKRS